MNTLRRSISKRALATTTTAFVATATLLLSGCASATITGEQSESAWQEQNFAAVYEQQLEWQDCGPSFGVVDDLEEMLVNQGMRATGIRCGWITAPLDWDNPDSDETIRLRAVHVPATGEKPIGTLLSNPGGPGASGIDLAIGLTATPSFAAVHEQYDLLGFDPRGMHGSSPIECESDTEILELQLSLCAADEPLALSMGTAQVARDMELMRYLMEDEKLHYAGFSYGTTIGASYATLFPENVGRIMLDSAWPSDWSSPLGSYLQHEAIVHATNDLLTACATDYEVQLCPLGGEDALMQVQQQLNEQPLIASDGTQVDGAMLNGYLTTALYKLAQGRHEVLDVTGRALAGEQAAIDDLAGAMAGGGMRVQLAGMVVRCLSSPRDPNLVGLYDYINEHGLPRGLGGPEINDDTIRDFVRLQCEGLPDSGEDFLEFSNQSDEPVLIFGITGDHATPYEGAKQLAKELGNATLVTLEGSGHIASYQGRSSCADDIATAYFLKGEMPAEGTVCTDD